MSQSQEVYHFDEPPVIRFPADLRVVREATVTYTAEAQKPGLVQQDPVSGYSRLAGNGPSPRDQGSE